MSCNVANAGKKWMLVGKKWRACANKWMLEYIGGKIHEGETTLDAACRVISTSTGFEVRKEDFSLQMRCFTDPWKTNEIYGVLELNLDLNRGKNQTIFDTRSYQDTFFFVDCESPGFEQRIQNLAKSSNSVLSSQLIFFTLGKMMNGVLEDL